MALSQQGKMIETSSKNSQNQYFKLYKNRGVLLLGYAPLLGIIRYTGFGNDCFCSTKRKGLPNQAQK